MCPTVRWLKTWIAWFDRFVGMLRSMGSLIGKYGTIFSTAIRNSRWFSIHPMKVWIYHRCQCINQFIRIADSPIRLSDPQLRCRISCLRKANYASKSSIILITFQPSLLQGRKNYVSRWSLITFHLFYVTFQPFSPGLCLQRYRAAHQNRTPVRYRTGSGKYLCQERLGYRQPASDETQQQWALISQNLERQSTKAISVFL